MESVIRGHPVSGSIAVRLRGLCSGLCLFASSSLHNSGTYNLLRTASTGNRASTSTVLLGKMKRIACKANGY